MFGTEVDVLKRRGMSFGGSLGLKSVDGEVTVVALVARS